MRDRSVMITMVICATSVALATLGVLGWALGHGYGTEALIAFVGTVLATYMSVIHGKLSAAQQQLEQQSKASENPPPPGDSGSTP